MVIMTRGKNFVYGFKYNLFNDKSKLQQQQSKNSDNSNTIVTSKPYNRTTVATKNNGGRSVKNDAVPRNASISSASSAVSSNPPASSLESMAQLILLPPYPLIRIKLILYSFVTDNKQQAHFKGITMLSDRKPPGLVDSSGFVIEPNCPPVSAPSIYPPKIGPKLPPWLAYDKYVLCFNAYFKETLQEVYQAPFQVRKVKILYCLEDGTMQVLEPKVENSGIPQGCMVHRQRIPKPPPCRSDFMSTLDLNFSCFSEQLGLEQDLKKDAEWTKFDKIFEKL
ncbi:hypothetical protein GQX74_010761 [Glossina fuscipes]|nr:hypothetical protein GQX74_010761 [Glossina fuscipes]